MSKLLLINGSPHEKGNTYSALTALAHYLNAAQIDTDLLYLGQAPISGCIDCQACIQTKKCSIDDNVNYIIENLTAYSGIIIGSPVYFGGPAGQLIAFLERFFIASQGRTKGKIGSCIVSCNKGGASSAIDFINNYFVESGMVIIGSHYENQVYNSTQCESTVNDICSLSQQIIAAINTHQSVV